MFPTPEQVADELLVLHAQSGDRRALAVLAHRWERRLLLHAMRLTNNPEGAREVTQETWLAITRGIARLSDHTSFRAWAYAILRRKAADWIRRRQRDRATTTLATDHPAPPDAPPPTPIAHALATLAPDERELITLHHVEGLGILELADVFSVPTGTIKSRLFAARAHLRAAVEAANPSEKENCHATHR